MSLHDGLLLLGAVVALYLYDSALLLYHNELVLVARRGGCRVSGGSAFALGGRHVFLPHPFCPHRPLYRLSWPQQGEARRGQGLVRSRRVQVALASIAPWTWLLLALFIVGLPYVLIVSRQAMALLAWFVAVYAVIAATLAQVYRRRAALNLSRRAIVALALDSLLCAPFALNIVRKIGLAQHFDADLRKVAATMLAAPARQELVAILRERITLSLGFIEPGTDASKSLRDYLNDFEELRE